MVELVGKKQRRKLTGGDVQERIPWTDVNVISDRQVEDLPQKIVEVQDHQPASPAS